MKNVLVTRICEEDPYGEELWESNGIFLEKVWKL
jgi:hypothetical protein